MAGITILAVFAIALLLNIPVAFALGIASVVTLVAFDIVPLGYMIQSFFSAADSFPLLAVPFFILAGEIMMHGGISTRLVRFAQAMMGGSKGALAVIMVFTCMVFASISGSGPATVAAIGGILIPVMIRDGYEDSFAASLAAASGAMGPVIPPSICFVMYGVIANVSITDLFIAGIIPGIMMGVALIIYVKIVATRRGFGSMRLKATRQEKWQAFLDAKWSLLIPVIILGGIYGGICTPTEAAIIACDYGLIIGIFVYRETKLKDLPAILSSAALTSGTCLVLIGCATAFGRVLTLEAIPTMLANAILSITANKFIILLLINLLLFVTGMLMETIAAIVILAPLLLSIVTPLGVDPIHFGVLLVVNLVIGMCTPPVGVNMFVAAKITDMPIERMFRWMVPMIGVLVVVQLVITYVPSISTFLPRILG